MLCVDVNSAMLFAELLQQNDSSDALNSTFDISFTNLHTVCMAAYGYRSFGSSTLFTALVTRPWVLSWTAELDLGSGLVSLRPC